MSVGAACSAGGWVGGWAGGCVGGWMGGWVVVVVVVVRSLWVPVPRPSWCLCAHDAHDVHGALMITPAHLP